MLAMRNREPRMAAAICTFSITVREMACHCRETVELVALFLFLLFYLNCEQILGIRTALLETTTIASASNWN